MRWRLSYAKKCIICMFEGGVNGAAALFSETTSSQVKLVFNCFFFVNRAGMLLARIVFPLHCILVTLLLEFNLQHFNFGCPSL